MTMETPILKRMTRAVNDVFRDLTADEMKALNEEIKYVSEKNSDYWIKGIADLYADDVRFYCEKLIK